MSLQVHMLPALSDNYIYILVTQLETAVIDPGNATVVLEFLNQNDLQLDKILCTHHHPDHVAGNLELKKKTNCKIYGSKKDYKRIPGIDETFEEGSHFSVGNNTVTVMDTFGHTVGHISYFFEEAKTLFCGDSLFSVGCGRLFEGTAEQMHNSLQKIAQLPEETKVYCGHEYTLSNIRFALSIDNENETLALYYKKIESMRNNNEYSLPTTIALEKNINPFLRCSDKKIRKKLKMESATDVEVFRKLRKLKDEF